MDIYLKKYILNLYINNLKERKKDYAEPFYLPNRGIKKGMGRDSSSESNYERVLSHRMVLLQSVPGLTGL
jgi:hypothetical protein